MHGALGQNQDPGQYWNIGTATNIPHQAERISGPTNGAGPSTTSSTFANHGFQLGPVEQQPPVTGNIGPPDRDRKPIPEELIARHEDARSSPTIRRDKYHLGPATR